MKMLMKRLRKPVAIALVIAMLASMSMFILGLAPPGAPVEGHHGLARASMIAPLPESEKSGESEKSVESDIPNAEPPEVELHSPETCEVPECELCEPIDETDTPPDTNADTDDQAENQTANDAGTEEPETNYTDADEEGYALFEIELSSDMRDFVSYVTVTHIDGSPIEPFIPDSEDNDAESPNFFDESYRFRIEFGEYYALQFELNEDGVLQYQLPFGLQIQLPVPETPIKADTEDGTIIGWYTISESGMVEVWFENLTIDGFEIEDSRNFVEFYEDVELVLVIDAVLLEESGGTLDFGNYWILDIPPVYYDTGMARAMAGIMPFGVNDDWDLANFVTKVEVFDITDANADGIPDNPNPLGPGDTTYLGLTYRFDITFAESAVRQFGLDVLGNMTYILPSFLQVRAAMNDIDIRLNNTGAVIGRYSITPGGGDGNLPAHVFVTWYNVDNNGNPTPNVAWINNYTNATFKLSIFAHLLPGSGGSSGDWGIEGPNLVNPIAPEPRPDIVKRSVFRPETMTIDYSIFVQSLMAPMNNIIWADMLFALLPTTPLPGIPIYNPTDAAHPTGFLSGFVYRVYRYDVATTPLLMPMSPTFSGGPSIGSYITYHFDPKLTLRNGDLNDQTGNSSGDYIRIDFTLDVQAMLNANPQIVLNPIEYLLNIRNYTTISAQNPNTGEWFFDQADVTDQIEKHFTFNKSGNANLDGSGNPDGSGYPWINWHVQVGDGVSIALNGGWVTENLQDGLQLPALSAIEFSFYGFGNSLITTATAAQLTSMNYFRQLSGSQFQLTVPPAWYTIPGTAGSLGSVYRLDINFNTNVTAGVPGPGHPPLNNRNDVTWNWPDGTGQPGSSVNVPIRPPTAGLVEKQSSGICDNGTGTYFIDYKVTLKMPAGLQGDPMWIYDDIGIFPGGSGVNFIPTSVTVNAINTEHPALTLPFDLIYTPIIPVNLNSWKMGFGTTDPNITPAWPFPFPVTVEIEFRVEIPQNTLSFVQGGINNYIGNNVRLVNSYNWSSPNVGVAEGTVGAQNTQEFWPIFKSVSPSNNPALFNYTVTMRGQITSRPASPFLSADANPVFRDDFDSRMMLVPDSFYVKNVSSGQIYAPAAGVSPLTAPNTISINLDELYLWNAPPNSGGVQGSAAGAGWYSVQNNFEFHYSLLLTSDYLGTPIPNPDNPGILPLTNTASITRTSPTGCHFTATVQTPYIPVDLSKGMTPSRPGSDIIHVEILVNADGSADFKPDDAPAGAIGPDEVVAVDTLENLSIYLDSVTLRTQNQFVVGGVPMTNTDGSIVWDGVWVEVPVTYNDYLLWSVNGISSTEFAFVIPNRTPVKLTYDALVTLAPGVSGNIGNKISIYGTEAEDGEGNYLLGDSDAQASASRLDVRVFKRDADNVSNPDTSVPPGLTEQPPGAPLAGATFDLYIAEVSNPSVYRPPAGLEGNPSIQVIGIDNIVRTFYKVPGASGVTTGANGMAILSDPWLATNHNAVFMLVETGVPSGYLLPPAPDNYTFFAINPRVMPSTHWFLPSPLNQISDFINVTNEEPVSIIIDKLFNHGSFPQIIGIPDGAIPSPLNFLVLGPTQNSSGITNDPVPTQTVTLDLNNPGEWSLGAGGHYTLTIPGMQPGGNYLVYESGGFLFGYIMNNINEMPNLSGMIPPGSSSTFRFINNYRQPAGFIPPAGVSPTIWIGKVIHGLRPAPGPLNDVMANITIVVESDAGFRQEIKFEQDDGFGGTLEGAGFRIEDLPPGIYTITELGAETAGFTLTTAPNLPFQFVVPQAGFITDINGNLLLNPDGTQAGMVLQLLIDNTYTPEPRGQISIQKQVQGIPPELITDTFALLVHNSAGTLVTRIPGQAALAGVTIANLPHVIYTITEEGFKNIQGYRWMSSTPALPYQVDISSTNLNINLVITNRYLPPITVTPTPPGEWNPEPEQPPIPIGPTAPPIDPIIPDITNPPIEPIDPEQPDTDIPWGPDHPDWPDNPPWDIVEEPPIPDSPQTGDTARIGLYLALLAAGIAALGYGVIKSRKDKLTK